MSEQKRTKEKEVRYSQLKSHPKQIRQAIFRFCVYGSLLIAAEVAFYTVSKIGKSVNILSFLFSYSWLVDKRFMLNHIWDNSVIPIVSLYGHASLYMFFVYGAICLFGLEPASRYLKKKDCPFLLRGVIYMCIILFMECLLGWILYWITGYQIWYYADKGAILTYTSWAIAPMWFLCGLITDNVINLVTSFDSLKMDYYGLHSPAGPAQKDRPEMKRNRIVIVSDLHVTDGERSANFSGIYPTSLALMFTKTARDKRVKELVLLGDIFDTWMYPVDTVPPTIPDIIDLWKDEPFMDALRMCIKNIPHVYYVPGNHDMEVTQEMAVIPGTGDRHIEVITAEAYNEAHRTLENGCTLYVEHGNSVDLFNAEDHSPDSLNDLPFGYYMTRLACTSGEPEQAWKEIIKAAIKGSKDFENAEPLPAANNEARFSSADTASLTAADVSAAPAAPAFLSAEQAEDERKKGNALVALIVNVLVKFANRKRCDEHDLTDSTPILMPEGMNAVTIGDVKTAYGSLFSRWAHRTDASILNHIFAAAGKDGLSWYARNFLGKRNWKLWFKRLFSKNQAKEVIVFGHTHYALKSFLMNREIPAVYANSGCYCYSGKQKMPTWIEVTEGRTRCRVMKQHL